MKILISNIIELGSINLPNGVEAVEINELEPVPEQHRDAEALVFGGADSNVATFLADLPKLKWIQSYWAGPDNLLSLDLPKEIIITNGVNFHDITVSEHALALALANIRAIPLVVKAKQDHRWANELAGIKSLYPKDKITTLWQTRVTIWGFGAIGQTTAKRFAALGSQVVGIARSAGQRAGFEVYSTNQLDEVLTNTDILVMILPSTAETHNALNAHALAQLPRRAQIVNVGRGLTVDEDALVAALKSGKISAAALDVMKNEPLAADSPLWDAPNLILTPHCAGFRPIGVEERIAHNIRSLLGLGGQMIGVMPRK